MKTRHAWILAAAIPASLALSACSDRPDTASNDATRADRAADASRGTPTTSPTPAPTRDSASDSSAGSTLSQGARDTSNAASSALERAGNAVTAASVTAAVKAELMKEPSLSAMAIDVDTSSNGKVTLSGEVDSATAKRRAEELTRSIDGVQQVENKLVVRPA